MRLYRHGTIKLRTLPLILLIAAVGLEAQQPRDLSGTWTLSAAPRDSSAPPRDAGPRTSAGRQVALLFGLAGAVPGFQIHQTDTTITVTNEDGFSYVLRPRGPEMRLDVADSVTVRYRARWDGSFLHVEWRPDGGGKITERYQLADSGVFLRMDVTVEYDRLRRTESRMYRKTEGDPSPGY